MPGRGHRPRCFRTKPGHSPMNVRNTQTTTARGGESSRGVAVVKDAVDFLLERGVRSVVSARRGRWPGVALGARRKTRSARGFHTHSWADALTRPRAGPASRSQCATRWCMELVHDRSTKKQGWGARETLLPRGSQSGDRQCDLWPGQGRHLDLDLVLDLVRNSPKCFRPGPRPGPGPRSVSGGLTGP